MNKYDGLRLENQICFPLYALSREVIKLYKPILDEYGLTYTQYVTLMALWEHEQIQFKDLAKLLHLDSGTLTPVLKKLEAMGFVLKYRNKEDDRNVTVELTEQGSLLKEKMLKVPEQVYCKLKGKDETLIQLKKSLDELLADF